MSWPVIEKRRAATEAAPNLENYEAVRAQFSWEEARRALDGLPGGRGLNIAHEAVDRHAAGERAHRVALRWIGRDGEILEYTSDDVFWCTDPGWVTGTSYGVISPLTNGVTSIVDEADFDAERWYRI